MTAAAPPAGEDRGRWHARVPVRIRAQCRSPLEIAVLTVMYSYVNRGNGLCAIGSRQLAEDTMIRRESVLRVVAGLLARGVITRTYLGRGRASSVYRLTRWNDPIRPVDNRRESSSSGTAGGPLQAADLGITEQIPPGQNAVAVRQADRSQVLSSTPRARARAREAAAPDPTASPPPRAAPPPAPWHAFAATPDGCCCSTCGLPPANARHHLPRRRPDRTPP